MRGVFCALLCRVNRAQSGTRMRIAREPTHGHLKRTEGPRHVHRLAHDAHALQGSDGENRDRTAIPCGG